MLWHLMAPFAIHFCAQANLGREVITIKVEIRKAVDDVLFLKRISVEINHCVAQVNAIPRKADDAFYKILRRIDRIVKHDNVAALNGPVREKLSQDSSSGAEVELICQNEVPDEKGVFHGLRRNAE